MSIDNSKKEVDKSELEVNAIVVEIDHGTTDKDSRRATRNARLSEGKAARTLKRASIPMCPLVTPEGKDDFEEPSPSESILRVRHERGGSQRH